jgi:hypothetical protein
VLDATPTTGTLVRAPATAAEVQYAPTLAPGGTLTDPNAAHRAPASPFGPPTPAAGPSPTSPFGPPTPPGPSPRRRSRGGLYALIGLVVVGGGVALGVGAMRRDGGATHATSAPDPGPGPAPGPGPGPAPGPGSDPWHVAVVDERGSADDRDHRRDERGSADDRDLPEHGDDDDDDSGSAFASAIAATATATAAAVADRCQPFVRASIEAGVRGDQDAMARAASQLASCETSKATSHGARDARCAALLQAGTDAAARGDHAAALAQLEAAYSCKRDAHTLVLAVIAACNAGDTAKAKHLAKHLTAADRDVVAPTCARNHVSVE